MFKQRLGDFVAVKDFTFDDCLKRETVFDVAHLVQGCRVFSKIDRLRRYYERRSALSDLHLSFLRYYATSFIAPLKARRVPKYMSEFEEAWLANENTRPPFAYAL